MTTNAGRHRAHFSDRLLRCCALTAGYAAQAVLALCGPSVASLDDASASAGAAVLWAWRASLRQATRVALGRPGGAHRSRKVSERRHLQRAR